MFYVWLKLVDAKKIIVWQYWYLSNSIMTSADWSYYPCELCLQYILNALSSSYTVSDSIAHGIYSDKPLQKYMRSWSCGLIQHCFPTLCPPPNNNTAVPIHPNLFLVQIFFSCTHFWITSVTAYIVTNCKRTRIISDSAKTKKGSWWAITRHFPQITWLILLDEGGRVTVFSDLAFDELVILSTGLKLCPKEGTEYDPFEEYLLENFVQFVDKVGIRLQL